ncbi:MAG: WG repeat-containing protein [Firmicutes bacterium]|nr:WG repeat-containing protein [Bacillota bacterium]
MKKTITLLLVLAMLLGLAACDVSIDVEEGHMSESFDLDEALEYISGLEPETVTVEDTTLLAPARDGSTGLFGFINLKGEWVVEPRYSSAVAFKEDVGLVLNTYSKYEYIDRSGRIIYNVYDKHPIVESNHFSEGILAIAIDNGSMQRYAYVNKSFQTVINAYGLPMVDWRYYENTFCFGLATAFNGDYAVVMRQRNIDCYDWLDWESAYVIDKSGTITAVLPAGLDPNLSGVDNNGNIIMRTTDYLFGLYSKEGEMLIECKYRALKHCEDDLYLAQNDKGFWGYLDQNGNVVIPFQYQKAYPFSEGLAAVFDGRYWGFIDQEGNLKIESVFDDVSPMKLANADDPDVNGNKGAFCEGRAAVKKDGYWIIIDQNEYPYICFTAEKCEGIDGCPFVGISNGYVTYKQNVEGNILCGVMTTSGKRVLDPSFTSIGIFN